MELSDQSFIDQSYRPFEQTNEGSLTLSENLIQRQKMSEIIDNRSKVDNAPKLTKCSLEPLNYILRQIAHMETRPTPQVIFEPKSFLRWKTEIEGRLKPIDFRPQSDHGPEITKDLPEPCQTSTHHQYVHKPIVLTTNILLETMKCFLLAKQVQTRLLLRQSFSVCSNLKARNRIQIEGGQELSFPNDSVSITSFQ